MTLGQWLEIKHKFLRDFAEDYTTRRGASTEAEAAQRMYMDRAFPDWEREFETWLDEDYD